jgi:hypothetical protein
MELVRDLAVRSPGTRVLSVYVRTDPRDPANTSAVPGWLVEMRNGLREVSQEADRDDSRDHRMAYRDLRGRAERDVLGLPPAERGRGLAWFLTADDSLDQRFTLQLPPTRTLVRWDDRPFVSPLVAVADRGRPTGLVLVSAEAIRLLHWQDGLVTEPAQSLYEIEVNSWRDYDAYVGHPSRSSAHMHVAEFDQRVKEWRQRFLRTTAQAVAGQVDALAWARIVLVGDPRVTEPFAQELPETTAGRIVGTVDANLIWEEHGAVAERLDQTLRDANVQQDVALAREAISRSFPGGGAAIGWPAVLDSLVDHRVQHLIAGDESTPDPDALAPHTSAALGWPTRPMLAERAVEQAVISGADVSLLPEGTPEVVQADGACALLRY